MAAYAVTDYATDNFATIAEATAALETYLETVTDTKTIRASGIVKSGTQFVGWVIHDA